MSNKHPLETALEELIEAKNLQGRAPVEFWKRAAASLEAYKANPPTEPVPVESNTDELNDLRNMRVAVERALRWAPPEPPQRPSMASAVAQAVVQSFEAQGLPPGLVRAQQVSAPRMVQAQAVVQ